MATITANTKTTTPTKAWTALLLGVALLMGLGASVNLMGRDLPSQRLNDYIGATIDDAQELPLAQRNQALVNLRVWQEMALAGWPMDPYAWARLSWLRSATQNDDASAFNALRMSDLVSPDEPRQLPRRALMWRKLRAGETSDELVYQDLLWEKAFRMQADATWKLAVESHIVDEVGAALKRGNGGYYSGWAARINQKP